MLHITKLLYQSSIILVASLLASCISAPQYKPPTRLKVVSQPRTNLTPYLKRPSYQFVGGIGDRLTFSLFEAPEYNQTVLTIDPNGNVIVPFIGKVKAANKSLEGLREEIRTRLLYYFRTPHITLQWSRINSSNITILGQVNKPGTMAITGPTRLTSVLAKAGGFRRTVGGSQAGNLEADLQRSFIRRGTDTIITPNFSSLLQGQQDQNIWVMPGDTIYVPRRAKIVYTILGEVNQPKRLLHPRRLSLLELIAMAGGLKSSASQTMILIQGALANPKVFKVPYAGILRGQYRNFIVRPGDILYVPPSGLAKFDKVASKIIPVIGLFLQGVRTFGSPSVVLNENASIP